MTRRGDDPGLDVVFGSANITFVTYGFDSAQLGLNVQWGLASRHTQDVDTTGFEAGSRGHRISPRMIEGETDGT